MLARQFLTITLIAAMPLVGIADAQSSTPQKPQPRITVSRATWSSDLEITWGITPQLFRAMGLGSLTQEQEVRLLTWALEQNQKAKDSVVTQSFDCGRPGEPVADAKPEAYDKVRVYVIATGDASEIISGVRERFRTMNGIDVVYGSDEADVVVSLVAIKTQTTGGYPSGHAVSIVAKEPCVLKLGTYTTPYDSLLEQLVQVGSDVPKIVDSIVSTIDTDVLESHRKSNAEYKKMLAARLKK